MSKLIVQVCAIIALAVVCIPVAFSQTIDFSNLTRESILPRQQCPEYLITEKQVRSSYAVQGFADGPSLQAEGIIPTGIPATSDADRFGFDASGWNDSLLESVAADLFKGAFGNREAAYYLDTETFCIAVSDIRPIKSFAYDSDNLSYDSIVLVHQGVHTPLPAPGIMFLGGIGLIGLSGMNKRKKRIPPKFEQQVMLPGRNPYLCGSQIQGQCESRV